MGVTRTEPYSSRSTPPLGYWDAWKCAGKFALHTASVDRSTESSLPCDRGIIDKQYQQGISGQRRKNKTKRQKLCLLKKMLRKSFLHCCSCSLCAFFFFLGFISSVGLLWNHNAYIAATAIALRLERHPAITVRSHQTPHRSPGCSVAVYNLCEFHQVNLVARVWGGWVVVEVPETSVNLTQSIQNITRRCTQLLTLIEIETNRN